MKAEIVSGALPAGKRDVAGLMAGIARLRLARRAAARSCPARSARTSRASAASSRRRPGRRRSRSFSGPGPPGSSGTVIEPYAIQAKFPHAADPGALRPRREPRGGLLPVGAVALPAARRGRSALPALGLDPGGRGRDRARRAGARAGRRCSRARSNSSRGPPSPGGGTVDRFELFVDGVRLRTAASAGGSARHHRCWPTATTRSAWWRSSRHAGETQGRGIDAGLVRQPRPDVIELRRNRSVGRVTVRSRSRRRGGRTLVRGQREGWEAGRSERGVVGAFRATGRGPRPGQRRVGPSHGRSRCPPGDCLGTAAPGEPDPRAVRGRGGRERPPGGQWQRGCP